ncbi:MAG: hypothetical protein HOL58_05050, partial [Francisellaceae bacterium]|nr:hypothetical protein [Francisellaceae bacterium]
MPSLSTNELDLRLVLPPRNIDDVVANYREMADEGGETANEKKERIRGYILRNDGVCSDVQSFLNMVSDEHGIVELSIMANDAFAASSMLAALSLCRDVDGAVDTSLVANPNSNAAILAIIAGRTATAADLVTILAHANHDAVVDTAVIANALTDAATLALIAARTATAADLVTISAHANHDAAVDTAVIANALTDAAT